MRGRMDSVARYGNGTSVALHGTDGPTDTCDVMEHRDSMNSSTPRMSRKPVTNPSSRSQASLSGKTRRANSELYRWMWEHYDQLRNGSAREGQTGSAQPSNSRSRADRQERYTAEAEKRPQSLGTGGSGSTCHRQISAGCHVDTSGQVSAPSPSLPHLRSRARRLRVPHPAEKPPQETGVSRDGARRALVQ